LIFKIHFVLDDMTYWLVNIYWCCSGSHWLHFKGQAVQEELDCLTLKIGALCTFKLLVII